MGAPTDLMPLHRLGETREKITDKFWGHYK